MVSESWCGNVFLAMAYLKCFPGLWSRDNELTEARMLLHKEPNTADGFAACLSPCTALLLSSQLREWLDGLVLSPVADT